LDVSDSIGGKRRQTIKNKSFPCLCEPENSKCQKKLLRKTPKEVEKGGEKDDEKAEEKTQKKKKID
jgi:hypothetical protein